MGEGVVWVNKALADETRLRIVALVFAEGDMCSCEIEAILQLEQSNASRHLQRLREAKILDGTKQAQWVHYRPNKEIRRRYPFIDTMIEILESENDMIKRDRQLLQEYKKSGYTCRTIHSWRPSITVDY